MKKIIHVDNSVFFRKLMKSFLEAEGFEVESFDSAQEADIVIGAGAVDMVITGLAFADTDGEKFVSKIVESFAGPVIVVSSSADNEEREKRLINLGIKAAIEKTGPWKKSLKPYLDELKQ